MTPASSRALRDKGAVLIASPSGRALAEAAARSGYVPLVADLFGDSDMTQAALASRVVKGSLEGGFDFRDLDEKLSELADLAPQAPLGLVCGAGFEGNAAALETLGKKWRLLGASPIEVKRVKDPAALHAALKALDIPCPETVFVRPSHPENWLVKSAGGAGGCHIKKLRDWEDAPGKPMVYFQREVPGAPVSALFLGVGERVALVGFSEQWTNGTAAAPFRFGGACHLSDPSEEIRDACADILARVAPLWRIFPLHGLFSVDFLVAGRDWRLIEINPRPGATLDIFDIDGANLFEWHVNAASGELPPRGFSYESAAAVSIVYAGERGIEVPESMRLPEWIKDRPAPGSRIEADGPLCTVFAMAATAGEALRLCEERARLAKTFFNKTKKQKVGRHDCGNLQLRTA